MKGSTANPDLIEAIRGLAGRIGALERAVAELPSGAALTTSAQPRLVDAATVAEALWRQPRLDLRPRRPARRAPPGPRSTRSPALQPRRSCPALDGCRARQPAPPDAALPASPARSVHRHAAVANQERQLQLQSATPAGRMTCRCPRPKAVFEDNSWRCVDCGHDLPVPAAARPSSRRSSPSRRCREPRCIRGPDRRDGRGEAARLPPPNRVPPGRRVGRDPAGHRPPPAAAFRPGAPTPSPRDMTGCDGMRHVPRRLVPWVAC